MLNASWCKSKWHRFVQADIHVSFATLQNAKRLIYFAGDAKKQATASRKAVKVSTAESYLLHKTPTKHFLDNISCSLFFLLTKLSAADAH